MDYSRITDGVFVFFLVILPLISLVWGIMYQAYAGWNGYPMSMSAIHNINYNLTVFAWLVGMPSAIVLGIIKFWLVEHHIAEGR